MQILPMTASHLPALKAIHDASDGVQRADWEIALTERFLLRNRGMSFVALNEAQQLVGGIFGAYTGLRGMIHHLCVPEAFRRQGIGTALVKAVEAEMIRLRLTNVAVGIVVEPYRDAFCECLGFSVPGAFPMMQADINPGFQNLEFPGLDVRTLEKFDGSAVTWLLQNCGDADAIATGKAVSNWSSAVLLPMVACFAEQQMVGVAFYECSGFRGLLLNFAIAPAFRNGLAANALLKAGLSKIASFGVLRVLARGFPSGDYRNELLLSAGFVELPCERIASKTLTHN